MVSLLRALAHKTVTRLLLVLVLSNLLLAPFNLPLSRADNSPDNGYTLASTGTLGSAHTAPVNDVAVAPDGLHLATAGADTLLKIWKLSGQESNLQTQSECTFYNFPNPLVSLAWSPDSRWIASGDANGGLRLWNLNCRTTIATPINLSAHQGAVRAVAFSPDGRFLASGGSDNTLRLWDLTSFQVIFSLDNGRFGINDLRWSPDGSQLAFVSTNGQLTLLNAAGVKSQVTRQLDGPGGALRSVDFSPDGHWLATGDSTGGITVWDKTNLELKLRFQAADQSSAVHSLVFSADGLTLADGAGDASVKLWSISASSDGIPQVALRLNFAAHKASVRSVSFGPGSLLVSSSDDQSVRLWNSGSGASLGVLAGSLAYQTTASWSHDGNFVVSGANDGKLRVWQVATGQLALTLSSSPSSSQVDASKTEIIRASAFSLDGQWLAAGDDGGKLQLWGWPVSNLTTPLTQITTQDGSILALAFSPDGQFIATAGRSGQVHLWRRNGADLQLTATTLSSGRVIRALAFSPTGNFLVSGDDGGKLLMWDSQSLKLIREIAGQRSYIKALAFDRSGAKFASAAGDGSVSWWDSVSGSTKAVVQFQLPVEALALSPDGQTLAASTDDGTITVWRASDSRPYLSIAGQSLTPLSLNFAPDSGSRLASATQDGALQIWNLKLSAPSSQRLPAPTLITPTTAPKPGFVQVTGGQLTLNGQAVKLKGFNFYPHLAPWAAFWQHWDGPQIATDLEQASRLGANSLRVLIPYGSNYEWTESDGTPRAEMLDELEQLLNLAAERGIRVLLTLYDFYGEFPLPGTTEEAANWRYLDTLLARYSNDPRILGWDLHNEPDNYNLWQVGNQGQVLDWLKRVALHLRQRDPNHFVTVGFGNWPNLSLIGPDGIDALALSQVVAFHAYAPEALDQQLAEVRSAGGAGLPTILEEFGWPSDPIELTAEYSENKQAEHYQRSLDFISHYNLSGGLAWTLWDFTPSSVLNLKPQIPQQFFGLVRLDGSLKPAAQVWQKAYPASRLTLPTSGVNPPPSSILKIRAVDPNLYPQYFPETGFGVPTPFKEYWNRMGRLDSFGYPISGIRLEEGYLVQYFERVRMEYHPEAANAPDYANLTRSEQLQRIVLLGLLTKEWLAREGRSFAPASPDPTQTYFKETNHNLGGRFQRYWEAHGGWQRFGLPLSEELEEVSATDGQPHLVQYFERARFEYHPEAAGSVYEVELGQLGREILGGRG